MLSGVYIAADINLGCMNVLQSSYYIPSVRLINTLFVTITIWRMNFNIDMANNR